MSTFAGHCSVFSSVAPPVIKKKKKCFRVVIFVSQIPNIPNFFLGIRFDPELLGKMLISEHFSHFSGSADGREVL